MPCPHKFQNYLNLDKLTFGPTTLIIGVFIRYGLIPITQNGFAAGLMWTFRRHRPPRSGIANS